MFGFGIPFVRELDDVGIVTCSNVGELLRGGSGGGKFHGTIIVGVVLRRTTRGLLRGDIDGLAED